eukprot:m.137581 g.137581  ORF g.137581 m.137581 type:complete len:556 (-) comp17000_c0_seq4:124-1791(-)
MGCASSFHLTGDAPPSPAASAPAVTLQATNHASAAAATPSGEEADAMPSGQTGTTITTRNSLAPVVLVNGMSSGGVPLISSASPAAVRVGNQTQTPTGFAGLVPGDHRTSVATPPMPMRTSVGTAASRAAAGGGWRPCAPTELPEFRRILGPAPAEPLPTPTLRRRAFPGAIPLKAGAGSGMRETHSAGELPNAVVQLPLKKRGMSDAKRGVSDGGVSGSPLSTPRGSTAHVLRGAKESNSSEQTSTRKRRAATKACEKGGTTGSGRLEVDSNRSSDVLRRSSSADFALLAKLSGELGGTEALPTILSFNSGSASPPVRPKVIPSPRITRRLMSKAEVQLAQVYGTIKTGDLLLMHNATVQTKVTQYMTASFWDHVGVLFCSQSGIVFVLEATGCGVTQYELRWRLAMSKVTSKAAIRHLWVERSPEMLDNFHRARKTAVGLPYKSRSELLRVIRTQGADHNETGLEDDTSSWFCSQLVASAYKAMGLISLDLPSSAFLPKDFGNESSSRDVPLSNGATLSEEIYLVGAGRADGQEREQVRRAYNPKYKEEFADL